MTTDTIAAATEYVVMGGRGSVEYGPASRSACRSWLRRASARAVREIYQGRTSGDYTSSWEIVTPERADEEAAACRAEEEARARLAAERKEFRRPLLAAIDTFARLSPQPHYQPVSWLILDSREGWHEVLTVDGTNSGRKVGILTTETTWEAHQIEYESAPWSPPSSYGGYLAETIRSLGLLASAPRDDRMGTTCGR